MRTMLSVTRVLKFAGSRRGNVTVCSSFAEVDIEVFDFRAPAAAESPFHSAAHSPTGAYVLDGCHGTGRGNTDGCSGIGVLGLAVGHATRPVQQEVRSRQEAEARPRGAEPLELMIGGDRGANEDRNDRAALLAGGLQVTLESPTPTNRTDSCNRFGRRR